MRAPVLSPLFELLELVERVERAGRVAFVACAGLVVACSIACSIGCSVDAAATTTHRSWSPPTDTQTTPASAPPQTRALRPLSECTSAPTFGEPLLVADARTVGDSIRGATSAPVDDDHRLVVIETTDSLMGYSEWWTLVDVRAKTTTPLQRFDTSYAGGSLVVLGEGRVAWSRPGAVRIFHRMGWSEPYAADALATPWITALDPSRVLLVDAETAMIFDESRGWVHAPPPLARPGEVVSANTTDDGFAMLLSHDGALSEVTIDASSRWTSSAASALSGSSGTILDDGSVVAVLFTHESDVGRLWVTRRRAPDGWSTPEPFPDVDGEPLRIDGGEFGSVVLSRGGRTEQIVSAWRCDGAGGTACTARVLDRAFDGAHWSDVTELDWPTSEPFVANLVGDRHTPVLLGNGVARIELDDGWSHPIGVHDGSDVIATTSDGFWMTARDPTGRPAYLYADARRYVVTRTSIPSEGVAWPTVVGVDAAGALVLSPQAGGAAPVRIATDGTLQSFGAPKDSYMVIWSPQKVGAMPPRMTAFAYAAHRDGGNAGFGAVAWNALGEATYAIDARDVRVWEASWEGCDATILYGVSQFGTSPVDRTLMMMTVHGDGGPRGGM